MQRRCRLMTVRLVCWQRGGIILYNSLLLLLLVCWSAACDATQPVMATHQGCRSLGCQKCVVFLSLWRVSRWTSSSTRTWHLRLRHPQITRPGSHECAYMRACGISSNLSCNSSMPAQVRIQMLCLVCFYATNLCSSPVAFDLQLCCCLWHRDNPVAARLPLKVTRPVLHKELELHLAAYVGHSMQQGQGDKG